MPRSRDNAKGRNMANSSDTTHTLLRAEGFSCPSCVTKIEKQVGKLAGVEGVSQRLNETEIRLASVVSGNVSSRLADYLLSLPGKPGPQGAIGVILPLAKKDVASFLSTTPESLSRQLRRLTDSGVISQYGQGQITITDAAALNTLSSSE